MVPKMCIFNASAMEIVRKHNPVYDFDGGVIVFFTDRIHPLLFKWFNFIPEWISNYTHFKGWDEISYPFPNFEGAPVQVWELIK